MARPIRAVEIYLPLDFNDGRPIPESKYVSLQQELLSRFGGVTSVQRQFPLQGVWRSGTDVYHSVLSETGHLQLAIYFDDPADEDKARRLVEGVTERRRA